MKKRWLLLLTVFCLLTFGIGCEQQPTTDPAATGSTSGTASAGTIPDATEPPETAEPEEPTPPAVAPNEIRVGKLRVQLLNNRLLRVEMENSDGSFEDRASFTVLNRTEWEDVPYTVTEEEGRTVIATANYRVLIPSEIGRTLSGVTVTSGDGSRLLWEYTTATTADVFLPSPSDELKSWYFMDAPRVIPSAEGYVNVESDDPLNGWDMSGSGTPDAFIFLPGGSYRDFLSDYVKLTGSTEMVTLPMLGFWDSRWYAYSAETALQQIKDYQSRGYSIDVLVIDTDWRDRTATDGVGYGINESLFPDLAGFLEQAHELGVSIMFNDHPEPVEGTDNLLDDAEIDYRTDNLKLILSLGLDIWWYDRNWQVSLNPVEEGLSLYTTGMYAFQFITEQYYESIADIGEYARRALIMANADSIRNGYMTGPSEIASHRYAIQWTGDIGSTQEKLAAEIFNAVFAGTRLSLPYLSADIGGHTHEVETETYIRWLQYGALSPIFRVHCTAGYARMPWVYGETAEEVAHTYQALRYRLLPLYYALAHENYLTGLPLVRRLDINYPQYAEADANDEYLLGDYLLVAPVTETAETVYDLAFTHEGQPGLQGEYFENRTLSGTPAATQLDRKLYFEYAKPDCLSVEDDFSIRWTGEVTVGDTPYAMRFIADTGLRVFIDGELVCDRWGVSARVFFTTEQLAAGETHSLVIEFFDKNGDALLQVFGVTENDASREVFLPDGDWMDVWSGKIYTGPATYSVSCGLTSSPVFVRMGSVIPLADVAANTGATDWSHLTLDVYPSESRDASFTLYEDDTETVAYKDGQYRTTDITLSPVTDNKATLKIAAAKGSFSGELAFTERTWTIRVHGREGWGALTGATLNGEELKVTTIARDPDAAPLAAVGGACDGEVYELVFRAPVSRSSTLCLTFAGTAGDGDAPAYDATAADFTVSVNKLTKSSAPFNATERGTLDYAIFGGGEDGTCVRKATDAPLIGELTGLLDTNFYLTDSNFAISWNDGETGETHKTTNRYGTDTGMQLTLRVTPETVCYKVYIGASRTVGELTVRDRAGNAQTIPFGNLDANILREVVITCSAVTETELCLTYSGSGVSVSAVTAAPAAE